MNKTLQTTLVSLLAAGALLLVACSDAKSSEKNTPAPVCNTCGVVKSIKQVSHRPQGSGLGAAMGAVVGGLAGSQVGGGNGKNIATVAGVVGGAVVGNNIERNRNADHYYEVGVAMENGDYKTINMANASGISVGSEVTVDVDSVHLR